MKPSVEKTPVTVMLTPKVKAELIRQADARGLSLTAFIEYMGAAFGAGSVFIIEANTYHRILEEEVKPSLWKWMKKMVAQEVELILVENGFLTRIKKH